MGWGTSSGEKPCPSDPPASISRVLALQWVPPWSAFVVFRIELKVSYVLGRRSTNQATFPGPPPLTYFYDKASLSHEHNPIISASAHWRDRTIMT